MLFGSVYASPAKSSEYEPHQDITIGQWHLSLNTGLGIMTNPLKGGADLPLVLIPEVAYYAEHLFHPMRSIPLLWNLKSNSQN